ncbi:MAG TPA: DUF1549 domain-containing protein, partial [Pirellulales bacterium]
GYDADFDYAVLTKQALGRRVTPADPGRSLILTKPTGLLPHGGGVRFETDSLEFKVLADWIADGAPPPAAADRRIERIEFLPRNVVLTADASQQLLVLAHFHDGHVEDVTRWVKYNSASADVASIDEAGKVKVMGYGEGAITAWYLSKTAIATVTVPYPNQVEPGVFAESPKRNFIDEHVVAKLQSLALPPSPRCTDGEFIRRASIDAIGLAPSPEEVKAFIADASPDKRERLIDSLLSRPEFVDYWAYKWSDLLLVNSEKLKPGAMWAYYTWIRNQTAADVPWDELVRRLVTAKGSTLENGAANFFVLHRDPIDLTETVSQAFLGMSINCARCHDHPLEKWTNDQYFAMANLFSRVRTKNGDADGSFIVYPVADGELIQPTKGFAQQPQPLEGKLVAWDDPSDRREHLAAWLTSPENPYFTRAIVNRIWANYLGVGLVEGVDDVRLTNPASNPDLFDAAGRFLVENRYDLKALMRAILQSETYQRSSSPVPGNEGDRRFYSRYFPRRLMAEVALDSASQALAAPTAFPGYPSDWRAIQLPDAEVTSYFLKTFGRPDRDVTCECERTTATSMVQAMHLANGDTLNNKLKAKNNRIGKLLDANLSDAQIVEEAYLAVVARTPSPAELQSLLTVLAETPAAEKRGAVEDLFWSLLTSKEFLFNH